MKPWPRRPAEAEFVVGRNRIIAGRAAGAAVGLFGGVPGVLMGFLIGWLLDQVFAEFAFRRSVQRNLQGQERTPLASLYALIVLAHRFEIPAYNASPSDEAVDLTAEAVDQLREHAESCCGVVFRGAPSRFFNGVIRAAVEIETPEVLHLLWECADTPLLSRRIGLLVSLGAPVDEVLPAWWSEKAESGRLLRVWEPAACSVLGLQQPADEAEVRSAFRKKALELHPDRLAAETVSGTPGASRTTGTNRTTGEVANADAGEEFIRLREAYELLLSRFSAQP